MLAAVTISMRTLSVGKFVLILRNYGEIANDSGGSGFQHGVTPSQAFANHKQIGRRGNDLLIGESWEALAQAPFEVALLCFGVWIACS
jgi:hypothetical protein